MRFHAPIRTLVHFCLLSCFFNTGENYEQEDVVFTEYLGEGETGYDGEGADGDKGEVGQEVVVVSGQGQEIDVEQVQQQYTQPQNQVLNNNTITTSHLTSVNTSQVLEKVRNLYADENQQKQIQLN